jgi:uncharacterized phage protein (TIGR01671 family)
VKSRRADMRDIEFRGKLKRAINKYKPAGSWIYGDYYFCGAYIREKDAVIGLYVDPETVGQYTGLKDKNGKKIFEGDIIELYYGQGFGKIKGVVTWKEKDCAFMAVDKINSPLSLVYVNENPGAVEVLGNIHDTPELLGRE